MAIPFACECGRKLLASDEHAGRRARCPSCGQALTVPTPAVEPEEDIYGLMDTEPAAEPDPAPTTPPLTMAWSPSPVAARPEPDRAPEPVSRPEPAFAAHGDDSGFSVREY